MSDPVVILGMHRSGTSFLVRALNLSGLWLGYETELGTVEGRASQGNPKGNYENRAAMAINDAILRESGGVWFRPPERIISNGTDAQRIRQFSATLERGQPANFLRWGWKDPRTLLTLDVWMAALERPIFIVAAFRHPMAVARSLLARNNIPIEVGLALWVRYNRHLLGYLDANPHALLRFDLSAEDLIAQTLRIGEITGLRADRHLIESWFDAQLVRSRAQTEDVLPTGPVATVWGQLLEHHQSTG